MTAFSAKSGEFYEHRLPEPPPDDKLAPAKATGVLVDRSVKLALVDNDNGEQEARSILGTLHERLLIAYERREEGDTDD